MDQEWKIAKPSAACCMCQTPFAVTPADVSGDAGEVEAKSYFSALFQNTEGLTRQDFCADCFSGKRPQNVYYFWKATVSTGDPAARRQPPVDVEYVLEFFKRLDGDNAPQRVAFRYILALMLTRKRMLIADGKARDAQGTELQVFREKRGGQSHRVYAPELNPDEIVAVTDELGVLLGLKRPAAKAAEPLALSLSNVPENIAAAVGVEGEPILAAAAASEAEAARSTI